MQRDYSTLVDLSSKRDLAEKREEREEYFDRYREAVREFVAEIVSKYKSADRTKSSINADLDDIMQRAEPDVHGVLDRLRYDLLSEADEQAGPSRQQQNMVTRLVGIGGVIVTVLLISGYIGLRQYSATPITASYETRKGLQERADALVKVMRFEAWGGGDPTSQRGAIRKVVLWPIEPVEHELKGAQELAAITFEGAALLQQERAACNIPAISGGGISSDALKMLEVVTADLRDPATLWADPAPHTILNIIKKRYPC